MFEYFFCIIRSYAHNKGWPENEGWPDQIFGGPKKFFKKFGNSFFLDFIINLKPPLGTQSGHPASGSSK